MVKAKLIALALALCCAGGLCAQEHGFSWTQTRVDGSRTGVGVPNADNVQEALGTVRGRKYHAPNGRVFKRGVTPAVAKIMIDAQDVMASVKEVVGYATRDMSAHRPESELSNWFVDELMRATEELTGRKVDVGITNFGGIRTDFYAGPILRDDVLSMFPFKNSLCYIALKGEDLRYWFEYMAKNGVQVVGGVKLVIRNRELVEATIGGEPIDDEKVYGLATISFLLNGGDGLSLVRNAQELIETDKMIIDVMLPYVQRLAAEGKPVEYTTDGRVVIL